jgi:hypothetical protein
MRNRDDIFTSATPGAPQARARRFAVGLAAAALLFGALPWTTAEAQQRRTRVGAIKVDDGARPSVALPRRSGFDLFAEEDLAQTGMRMTGTNGWSIPNVGPCPFYYIDNTNAQTCALTNVPNRGASDSFFEIGLLAGAPISEFRKIRAIHPGINNMRPPLGYTAPYTAYLAAPFSRRWGPGDGQFGNYYSGVTSTSDGSCRDHTSFLSGNMPTGFTLTAGSDCPATWANGVFAGKRPFDSDSVLALAERQGASFRFDEHRLPASVLSPTGAIGDFATYGLISDSYREILQRFGSVTPRGSGPSQERGYPLGLDIRYDAFQFSRPSVRNVVYYQMTIVNNSARVYGQGISYDSLYMGLHPGILFGGPQFSTWYFDYSRNAVVMVGGNTSGLCSATYPRRTPLTGACVNTTQFADGAQAFVFLKSPLGDMRNKLFSRPTSAFSRIAGIPANILDDTITFNHARRSSFGANYNATTARSDRALFGFMSSTEENFLDGRSITADFTAAQLWTHFQSEDVRSYTGTVTPELARFNRFVPGATSQPNTPRNPRPGQPYGSWDYNNDGVQDTIYVPGCGRNGCHDIYSDTSAAGTNIQAGNVGNVVSFGPFKLAAGDTTQVIIAFIGAGDIGTFEAQVNASIENYLNFYAGPSPVPPPTFEPEDIDIIPATVRDTTAAASNTLIRLRIDQAPVRVDPFVFSVYERIRTSTDPNIVRIRTLNPDLLRRIQERINVPQNYAELLVFKSCDRGATFTVSANGAADCTPAPANGANGAPIGFGWQPWRRIPVNSATGQLTTSFVTDIVRSGRTYLYSFVTRTRGLIDIPIVDSVTTPSGRVVAGTNLAVALNIDADTIASPLSRSGPSTVIAYAPISLPAGVRTATLDTTSVTGTATTRVTAQAIGTTQSGRYRVYFANRFIVTTVVDTTRNAATTTVVAQRVVGRASVATGTTNGPLQANFVAQQETFTGPGFLVTDGSVTIPGARDTVRGTLVITVDTVNVAPADTAGYVIARDSAGNTKPFYLSTRSRSSATTNAGTTLAFRESRDFPGFTLTIEGPQANVNTPRLSRTLRAEGDTIDAPTVANNGVVVIAAQTSYRTVGGRYEFTYSDDAFGPNAPFLFITADSLQNQVTRSLAARTDVTTADTAAATKALIVASGAADTSVTNRPLVAARFPFTVRTANGQTATLAMFRRFRDGTPRIADSIRNNSRVLGNNGDTLRVTIPTLQWVPGDTIFIIETALRDSVTGSGADRITVLRDSSVNGRTVRVPIQVPTRFVAGRFVLSCTGTATVPVTTQAPRCNPLVVGTFGATGYLPYRNGWEYVAEYARSFDLFSELRVEATGQGGIGYNLTSADVSVVRVVPNPYVVQSNIDDITGNRVGIPRVMFTSVPLQGVVRVYSVSGQLMQQLSWTAADLQNTNTGQTSGDLPFILRSREGLDMGSGLYLYVLTATGPGANGQVARGKFVIIR